MAKILRKTMKQFGGSGPTSSFGQFGSKEAGTPQTSQDPSVIQALAAWIQGWQDAVAGSDKAAYMEDMNGLCYVLSYMLTYVFQAGISEWDATTIYFQNSAVQVAGQWFNSLQDNNTGNVPPTGASNAFWQWVNPPQDLVGTATVNKIPKVTSLAPVNGVPGSVTLSDSAVSDDGVDVILALPLKFPDATIQTTAAVTTAITVQAAASPWLGTPTASRVLGTVYRNNTGKPVFVSVSTSNNGNNTIALSDSSASPGTTVARCGNPSPGADSHVFFIVLPLNYYVVNGGGGSLQAWVEYN